MHLHIPTPSLDTVPDVAILYRGSWRWVVIRRCSNAGKTSGRETDRGVAPTRSPSALLRPAVWWCACEKLLAYSTHPLAFTRESLATAIGIVLESGKEQVCAKRIQWYVRLSFAARVVPGGSVAAKGEFAAQSQQSPRSRKTRLFVSHDHHHHHWQRA